MPLSGVGCMKLTLGFYSHEQHWHLAHRGTGQSLPHDGSRAKTGRFRSQAASIKSGELAETAHPRAIIGNAALRLDGFKPSSFCCCLRCRIYEISL